jgi:hypothetical protein
MFLNLSGLPHLIPLFESHSIIAEQLELISNSILELWKVQLLDRKQYLYHRQMLITNRFQDENHKGKCSICRCPLGELLKEWTIKLNLDKCKEIKFRAYHLMYFTDVEISHTFEISPIQAASFVKSFQAWKEIHQDALH